MRASELMAARRKAIEERGDLLVSRNDPDTQWALGISVEDVTG
jgi:hypothetical protein